METNTKRTGENKPYSFWGGVLFGCLTVAILGMCLVGGVISLIARADGGNWVDRQPQSQAENPSQNQAGDAVQKGQQIFQSRCSSCHSTGTDLQVGPGLAGLFSPGGPDLPDGVDYGGNLPNGEEITDESVAQWIREGGRGEIGRMPDRDLDDQEMSNLLSYLKTLQK